MLDDHDRREIARDALDCPSHGELSPLYGDPYWLKNMYGRISIDEVRILSESLHEDAEYLAAAAEMIESGAVLPEEAALWLAERLNFGGYETDETMYDSIPIDRE